MARNHKSTYAARNERAKSMGYRSYAEQRKARQTGAGLRPGDKPGAKRVQTAPNGRRIVSTTKNTKGLGYIEAQAGKLPPDLPLTVGFDITTRGGTRSLIGTVSAGDLAAGALAALVDLLVNDYPGGNWTVTNTGPESTPGRLLALDVTMPNGDDLASFTASQLAEIADELEPEPVAHRSYNPDGTDDF